MNIIAFQPELSPEIPELSRINGAKDYREFRATLVEMNHIVFFRGMLQNDFYYVPDFFYHEGH